MAVQSPPPLTALVMPAFERLRFSDEYVSSDNMSTPSTPSTPCTPPAEPYEISFITEDDKETVLDFLRKFFFRDEPLNASIKLLEDENSRCLDLENYCVKDLADRISFKATTASGTIIGICLNGIALRGKVDEFKATHEKFKLILDLLDTVEDQADVFGRYPDVDKIMYCKILSVDGAWRGRRIAQELVRYTEELAKEKGCGLVDAVCSSHFSAKAMKRLGYECIYTLNYEDYKVNGETVFKPEHPHTAVTVYVKRI